MKNKYVDVTGYILAGGKSRRLGRDKRLLRIDGVTLLERAQIRLSNLLKRKPYLVGNNLDSLMDETERIIPDAKPDCGPLGGLVAALHHCPTEWSLILAIDLPMLTIYDLQKLLHLRSANYDLICLGFDTQPEPLIALYRKRSLNFWLGRLDKKSLSIIEGIELLRHKVIDVADKIALANINNTGNLEGLNVID